MPVFGESRPRSTLSWRRASAREEEGVEDEGPVVLTERPR